KIPKGKANSMAAKRDRKVSLRCTQVLSKISTHLSKRIKATSSIIFFLTRKSWAISAWLFFSNKAKELSSCISSAEIEEVSLDNASFALVGREDLYKETAW